MTSQFGAFAGRLAKAPATLKATEREMVRAAALVLTVAERATLSTATNGSNMLRGVGRAGAKLSVGFDIKGTGSPTALVRAKGPWQLIEDKTKPHVIAVRGRRGARALAGRGFGPVASVNHPGTPGKQPWAKGLATGMPVAASAATAIGQAGMTKAFLGL